MLDELLQDFVTAVVRIAEALEEIADAIEEDLKIQNERQEE